MYELDSAEAPRFRAAMEKMKENNKFSSSVWVYSEEEYANMRLFMAEDGKSGLAIKDGDELVSAWSDPTSKNKKVARHLVATGIEQGGRRADAFDTVLPGIYALEGLRVKARLKWDDKEAPKDWKKEDYAAFNGGEPDVAFLAYDESKVDQPYVPGEGDYVADYGAGIAASKSSGPKQNSAEAAGFKRNPKSLGESSMRAPDAKEIKALRVSPYTSPHVDENGEFTPERKKLHEKIITDFLEGLEPQENPVQYMNGGGPASGKGSMTKGRNAELTRYPSSRGVDERTGDIEPMEGNPGALLIDPDAIKMQFPEVKLALERIHAGDYENEDKGWAGHSHEESSQLAKRLHAAALDRGYNVIYDGTGNSSADSVRKKVAAAREAGYKVEANYLFLQPTEGISRAKSRADRSHRIVPEEQIRGTYAVLPEIFDQLKADGTFDKVNLFDNNRDGEPARLVGSGDGKNFNITDQDAYDAYMASGASAWEGYEPPPELAAKLEKLKTTDSSKKAKAGGVSKVA